MANTSSITDAKYVKTLMVDANIIIPFLDNKHDDFQHTNVEINRLFKIEINFYYSQPCLLEVLNYWRS